MKTEQEQRRAIRQILFDANDICQATPCENEYCIYHGDYRCYDNVIVDKLIRAGYGDVSEYKAEIKRLKSNTPQHLKDLLIEFDEMGFAPTTVCPNPDKYATEWRDRLVNCVNNAIKQAKIDMLNEVRERLTEGRVANDNVVINANYEIGKLIKEVEK